MAGPLLEFETEMFLSLFGCDGLLVAAEGMGIDRILLQFMRVYSEQGSLVLLLNTTAPEQVRTLRGLDELTSYVSRQDGARQSQLFL